MTRVRRDYGRCERCRGVGLVPLDAGHQATLDALRRLRRASCDDLARALDARPGTVAQRLQNLCHWRLAEFVRRGDTRKVYRPARRPAPKDHD